VGSWRVGVLESSTTDLLPTKNLHSDSFFSDLDFLYSQQVYYGVTDNQISYTNATGVMILYPVGAGLSSSNIPSELVFD
jgi:hypothetical protein